jgi:hypothetical protein
MRLHMMGSKSPFEAWGGLRPNKALQLTPNSRVQSINGTIWQRALSPAS